MEDELPSCNPTETTEIPDPTSSESDVTDISQVFSTNTLLAKQSRDSADKTDDLSNNINPQANKESEDAVPDLTSAEDADTDTTPAVEDTTLSQSYLFRQGVGIAKSINANIFNLTIPDTIPLDMSPNTTVYMSLCEEAKSFTDLIAKVVNRVITPLLFLKKIRKTIAKKTTPEV